MTRGGREKGRGLAGHSGDRRGRPIAGPAARFATARGGRLAGGLLPWVVRRSRSMGRWQNRA